MHQFLCHFTSLHLCALTHEDELRLTWEERESTRSEMDSVLLLLKLHESNLLEKELENTEKIGQRIKDYESTRFPLVSVPC